MKRVVFLDYIRGVWTDLWLELSTGNLNFDQMIMYIARMNYLTQKQTIDTKFVVFLFFFYLLLLLSSSFSLLFLLFLT